ncbi:cyclically-permuted mutarotase family protein [Flavobacterium granuli]|uniref:Cyclically-permuted mutarotase family protein n=2 Tax=Flavobacterium granuli TaxID=280093 RepID=A0A1M5M3N5_9FLAO|nr:cyclically-permuted mutarotase family protein [Flavobacterium granuli]SHG71907.1 cyclically-permuted mutarotase family protein [Flavobacterium granuli]
MTKSIFSLIFISLIMSTTDSFSQKKEVKHVEWKTAAQLQNPDGSLSIGFAGAINGISNDVLLVTGGANFPDKMPWEGGKKSYSKTIHVLQKCGDTFSWIAAVKSTLAEPIAYCGTTSTDLGVVYVGGENENGLSNKSYILKWNAATKEVETKSLPNFPLAIANIALTHIDNVVYAVGGDEATKSSDYFASLDLNEANPEWKTLPKLPLALANSVAIAQKGKNGTNIYVVGGRTKTASGISDLHNTTFVFDLKNQQWKSVAPISDGKNTTNFSAGAGVAVGNHSVLIVGGDNGEIFHQIETYLSQIAQAEAPEQKTELIAKKNKLVTNHPGFYNGILLYNTLTDQWKKIGELPFLPHVTTPAVLWDKKIILSNGEIKPGIRTPDIMLGTLKK